MPISSPREANRIPALVGTSSSDGVTPVLPWVDPTTHRILTDTSISGGGTSSNFDAAFPAAGTAVGVKDSTGTNMVAMNADASGNLKVVASAGTNLNTSALALETGGNLASVKTNTDKIPAQGQALMAASMPIVIASNQSAVPVSGNLGADLRVGSAAVTTANPVPIMPPASGHLHIDGDGTAGTPAAGVVTVQGITGMVAIKVDGSAVTQPVSGTFWQATQPVSAASLPLPTGASTETTLAAVNTFLGAKTDAKSTATDATSVSAMQVLKQISASVQAPPSQAVTNAGTFATQATLQTQTDTVMVGGVNIKEINAVTPLMGNGATGTGSQRVTIASDNSPVAGLGAGATGAAVPANAVYNGLIATTANPSAATAGNTVGAMADKLGRQVVVVGNVRDLKGNQITTITASTSETTVVTAVASTFLDVYGCIVANSSATAANVSFKDSTAGTTQFNVYVPAGETRGFMLPSSDGFKQGTVNNNWTATSSASVSSLIISMLYVKNI